MDDVALGPEARYEPRESIALSFVAGLQSLPTQQRAALVLRDVLGFSASETAEMLESTPESVNSALQRAAAEAGSNIWEEYRTTFLECDLKMRQRPWTGSSTHSSRAISKE